MAVSIERTIHLNTRQEAAVATGLFLKNKRGELVVSGLPKVPAGLHDGETAFEYDSLGGVKRVLTQSTGDWQEVFLFGPISNRDRTLIAEYFGLNEEATERLAIDQIGSMSFQRKYLVTLNEKGGGNS